MIFSENMTNAECLRINGTLPVDRMEALIDLEESNTHVEGLGAYVNDAKAQFPNEDFLGEIIDKVNDLAKRIRGDNRKEAELIAKLLTDTQQEVHNSTEEGLDLLKKMEKALEEAGL